MSPPEKSRVEKSNWIPSRRASFFFVLSLLLASLAIVFLVFREARTLDQILQEIDSVQDFALQEVPDLRVYRGALNKASGEVDYLRILKRAYAIRKEDVRRQYLNAITEEAVRELPNSEKLWSYRVSALLEMEDLAAAATAAEHLQSVEYLSLKGEILVRSLAEADSTEGSSIGEIIANAPDIAATYISLARLFDEPRFAFNAAILHMVRGDKSSALNLIRDLQGQAWLNPFAAGLIAYDNQAWDLAIDFFEQLRGIAPNVIVLQYLGNSYARLGRYEKVVEVLSEARELVDKNFLELRKNFATEINQGDSAQNLGSWKLFYNLASAYHEIGEDPEAFRVLRQGRSAFPQSSHLLFLLNAVAPADEREYAKSMLSEFVDSKSNSDPELALALLIFDRSRANQQKYSSELWELFSSFPKYNQILRYLLWYFIGLNQTDDVSLALDRYRNLVLREEEGRYRDFPNWAKEYMAINALLQRDFATAENVFAEIDPPTWYTYYNMANAEIYKADFTTALGILRQALESTRELRNRVSIFYRMLVLSQISGQNFFFPQEIGELEDILSSHVRSNYERETSDVADEGFYAKLDSLVLWYKQTYNGESLVDPQEFQVSLASP